MVLLKRYRQINNWVIKEKSLDEVPSWVNENRRFVVFAPDGRCMEDNLLQEEAIDFCNENKELVNK